MIKVSTSLDNKKVGFFKMLFYCAEFIINLDLITKWHLDCKVVKLRYFPLMKTTTQRTGLAKHCMSVKEWNLNSPFLIKLFCLFALAPLFTCCLCSQSFPVPEEACHNTCGLRQTNNLAFGHFLDGGWVRRLLLSIRMPWHGRDATVASYLKTLEKEGHICSFVCSLQRIN